jgi:hypothetical protein
VALMMGERVGTVQIAHAGGEIALANPQQQVIAARAQAPGQQLPVVTANAAFKQFEKHPVVGGITEQGIERKAARGDEIGGIRHLNA